MFHLIAFVGGLGIVVYGVLVNTKSQVSLRKKLLKKYILMYLITIAIFNFAIIPIMSLLKN